MLYEYVKKGIGQGPKSAQMLFFSSMIRLFDSDISRSKEHLCPQL